MTFALLNGVTWGFGAWAAPRIWNDVDDQVCQEEGYWYAKSGGEYCERWYLIPLPRLKR